ncbi:hypothetical protein [Actinomadura sp. HBU206391]|uniref:hypothetical protein n=1 Tax=Actinomadura sp. HBU206391 TaxID=2731692 RepID=UPI00164FE2B2|nr:hypothetical protein [Actinomadura sp. HBU206391]MBC6459521.1 hypothetical protein [Actinomadura sp. HBU206391]
MSVSIYYRAERPRQLDEDELTAVDRLIAEWDTDRFCEAGGESFCVYDREGLREGEVFAGATKLPGDMEVVLEAIDHWISVLGMIRQQVPDANWNVSVDHHTLIWDEETQEYDFAR